MRWVETTLGKSFELYQPQTITTKDLIVDGEYQVYGANGVIGRYDKYNHEEPQLLVTCRGATCGAVNFSSPFSWINGNAMVVKPKSNDIDVKFVEYFFRGAVDLTKAITGAAQPQITRQSLSPISFKYPVLDIQKKIVSKLDAIFAEIDKATAAAEANTRNAEALFQSYISEVFERGGEDWSSDKLERFVDIKHGFAFDGENFEQSDNDNLPIVLTPGNFTEDGKLYFTSKNTKRLLKVDKKSNLFNVGDLVVVMTDLSSKMKILGKPAVIDRDNILHNQRIGLFQFKSDAVHKSFLYYFLKTRKYIEAIKATSTGSMVRHTAPKRILATKINYPEPKQQIELAFKFERLSIETENIFNRQNKKIIELSILKNSVLKQAFNGELVKE